MLKQRKIDLKVYLKIKKKSKIKNFEHLIIQMVNLFYQNL